MPITTGVFLNGSLKLTDWRPYLRPLSCAQVLQTLSATPLKPTILVHRFHIAVNPYW